MRLYRRLARLYEQRLPNVPLIRLAPHLYVRRAKIWISRGSDWISTASGSERSLRQRPPLPLAVLTCRFNPDTGAPNI